MKGDGSEAAVNFQNHYAENPAASPAPSAPLYIPGVGFSRTGEENVYHQGVDFENAGTKYNAPPLPPPRAQSDPIKPHLAVVTQDPTVKTTNAPRKTSGRWKIACFSLIFIVLTLLVVVTLVSLVTIFKLEDRLDSQRNMLQAISTDINDDVLKRLPLSGCHAAVGELEVRRVYPLNLDKGLTVYCDGVTDGGGWMVFQYRSRNRISFNQSWSDYVDGFGTFETDYWLGLQTLHELTSEQEYELRVDLVDWCGYAGYAQYSSFRVDGSDQNYRLHISGYQGNISNSLSYSDGRVFAVPDSSLSSCSRNEFGGWWYSTFCSGSNLNGEFIRRRYYTYSCYDLDSSRDPMFWDGFRSSRSYQAAIGSTSMKIRPKNI